MIKLKKITIENFRGIRLPVVIDFTKGGNLISALVYGRNGSGKSSIVDAWEWFNNFEIGSLNREGVLFSDFPHKACGGNNCYVSAEFQHPTITSAKVLFNNKKITTPNITGEYSEFKTLSTYPNYLRYSDLQEFVYKKKAERYKYIARFFGLEKFSILQDTLQTSINKQAQILQTHQTNLNRNTSTLNSITGLNLVDENAVLGFVNSIAVKHGISTITNLKNANNIKISLERIVQINPIAKELVEWKAFQSKQNQYYPITTAMSDCKSLETLFTDLKKDEESIKQLILSSLYELSIKVIPKLEDKTKCPVCDNKFEGDLLEHITQKHASLDSLNKMKIEFDKKKADLEK